MSDPYTPTTGQVRELYAKHRWTVGTPHAEFDRWLAAHDAEVRADERERCAQIIREERDRLEVVKVWAAIRAVTPEED